MRNTLALVGFVVVGFAGLGWYLNWYKLAVQPGADGKQHISVDVDTKKIAADTQAAVARIAEEKNKKTDPKDEAKALIDEFVGPLSPGKDDAKDGATITLPSVKIGVRRDRE